MDFAVGKPPNQIEESRVTQGEIAGAKDARDTFREMEIHCRMTKLLALAEAGMCMAREHPEVPDDCAS